jgi:hypothetical protein
LGIASAVFGLVVGDLAVLDLTVLDLAVVPHHLTS